MCSNDQGFLYQKSIRDVVTPQDSNVLPIDMHLQSSGTKEMKRKHNIMYFYERVMSYWHVCKMIVKKVKHIKIILSSEIR